ncbi:hypothetical protein LCGC14_0176290 [marine sediment metagenome]|uniref:Uncharacterized protein n=1 Tax=marine sediment metagenome TaxID=412755 RepID=A0A0F9URM6_9ZZZZ
METVFRDLGYKWIDGLYVGGDEQYVESIGDQAGFPLRCLVCKEIFFVKRNEAPPFAFVDFIFNCVDCDNQNDWNSFEYYLSQIYKKLHPKYMEKDYIDSQLELWFEGSDDYFIFMSCLKTDPRRR